VRWAPAIAALLIAVHRVKSAAQVVVPNAQATVEGNDSSGVPFDCEDGQDLRYQQVYLGSEVGSGTITEIRFRQNAGASAFGPTITPPGVIIALSSTTAAPDSLSATFANNVGADVTTVFSGNLTLSSAACPGAGPCPFDIAIALQTPFSFNATGGLNLLLDVSFPACTGTAVILDAQNTLGDSVSEGYEFGQTGIAETLTTRGVVTQFTVASTSIPTLSEWAMIAMIVILVGIAVWRLRRRPALSA
jgi:hypothetical protein